MSDIDKKELGIYPKFSVRRLHPSSRGIDHTDCFYFVLDPEHDPAAREALTAYAAAAAREGYYALAEDIRKRLDQLRMDRYQAALEQDLERLQQEAAGKAAGDINE